MKTYLEQQSFRKLQNDCMALPERIKNGKNAPPPYCNSKERVVEALLKYSYGPPNMPAPRPPALPVPPAAAPAPAPAGKSAAGKGVAKKGALKSVVVSHPRNIKYYIEKFSKAQDFGTTSPGNLTKKIDNYILKRISLNKRMMDGSKFERHKQEFFQNELDIARRANHENIIKFFDTSSVQDENHRFGYILQELGTPSYDHPDHLNLRSISYCKNKSISLSDIFCAVTHDFSRGLHYLHTIGYVAADVKLKNSVMFNIGPNLRFKLIDFGHASIMSNTVGMGDPFTPPECLMTFFKEGFTQEDRDVGNRKLDEFILGSVLMDILTWTVRSDRSKSCSIETYMPHIENMMKLRFRKVPSTYVDWLDGLLKQRPSQRINMENIAQLTKGTLRADFEKLSDLPFSFDRDEYKSTDFENNFCMSEMNDAY